MVYLQVTMHNIIVFLFTLLCRVVGLRDLQGYF